MVIGGVGGEGFDVWGVGWWLVGEVGVEDVGKLLGGVEEAELEVTDGNGVIISERCWVIEGDAVEEGEGFVDGEGVKEALALADGEVDGEGGRIFDCEVAGGVAAEGEAVGEVGDGDTLSGVGSVDDFEERGGREAVFGEFIPYHLTYLFVRFFERDVIKGWGDCFDGDLDGAAADLVASDQLDGLFGGEGSVVEEGGSGGALR